MFRLEHLKHAKILFMSGEKDLLWNTTGMVRTLISHNPSTDIKYVFLKDAGHLLFAIHKDENNNGVMILGDTTKEALSQAEKAT